MATEERKIEVSGLQPGMYVSRLDRAWEGTPFLLQGFLVESSDDVATLSRLCEHVYIDVEQGLGVPDAPRQMLARPALTAAAAPAHRGGGAVERVGSPGAGSLSASLERELPDAAIALDHVAVSAPRIIEALRAGEQVGPAEVALAVEPVVSSLVRNADAFFWLEALRARGDYAYSHAVNCCALSVALGRQLGLPDAMLRDLAAGGLLLDIGMTQMPVLDAPAAHPFDPDIAGRMRPHVQAGVALYRASGGDNPVVLAMLGQHHERHDGSGYPQGLAGDGIDISARIAGIVDSYDAMTSTRPHHAAVSRHDALQAIYRERDRLYQDELIEQFMQCLGIYPVGSLVELNSGEVAVVMAQNPTRRLRPVLMLLTDTGKALRDHFRQVDLMFADRAGLPEATLAVVRGLPAGAFGLEPSELYL